MKIFDPDRHLPLGWEWDSTRTALNWGHFFSTLPLLTFLPRYSDSLEALYRYIDRSDGTLYRELVPGRTIAPFRELLAGWPLIGLWLFLAVMPLLVLRYYRSHTQGAMSVYTMRRLPDRWELHRRCWIQPLCSAALELAIYAVLVGLCWLLWRFLTPAACLPH